MKKIKLLLFIIMFIPILNLDALSCYGNKQENAIDVLNDFNFSCSQVKGENFTFETIDGEDYSSYFSVNIDSETAKIDIINKELNFNTQHEFLILKIGDGNSSTLVYFKNNSYKPTTKKEETTTTKNSSIIYTVTLDDGNEKTKKTCTAKKEGEICYVTLPTLEINGFNGWGTASTCKEGQSGSIKVKEDITYYACYINNAVTTLPITKNIYLKSLNVFDANTNEKIDIGTFSIRKTDYEFKVLNETEILKIETEVDEGINVEIIGNEGLLVGENEVIIKLKDDNNNINEYILNINRLEEGKTLNSIHYLSALVIGNIELDFDKNKFDYTIKIPSDYDKLAINPILENENDEIEVIGNTNLTEGSKIYINVTGDDNKITTYTLNIDKEVSSNNIILIVAIIVITLLIILLIVIIIIKKNKNKKNMNPPTNGINVNTNASVTKIETLDL